MTLRNFEVVAHFVDRQVRSAPASVRVITGCYNTCMIKKKLSTVNIAALLAYFVVLLPTKDSSCYHMLPTWKAFSILCCFPLRTKT